jgi:UDP-N-acetylglucosamine 2-epimerase (non-hydrolysing)
MSRVMLVFGTRPEAIKMAPVVQALRSRPEHEALVTVTAQHREMLDQVLDLFGIKVDHDLDVSTPRQGLAPLTTRALDRLMPVVEHEAPDTIIVQGDTTTTLVGALAGFYARVPVVHLEAGLRTGDPQNPFPEEMNRRLTTRMASLHLAATPLAQQNLLAEGVGGGDIVTTGNTVIDALLWSVAQDRPAHDPLHLRAREHSGPVVLVTTHRRESWGEPLRRVAAAIAEIARRHPEVLVVLPLHRNPVVREAVLPTLNGLRNVAVGEPSDYWSFGQLMQRADILLSDSGGVQEEGPSLGKPVLVMRDNTERPEAIEAGVARLVGTDPQRIIGGVTELLVDSAAYDAMARRANPYGDGHAAERTVAAIEAMLSGDLDGQQSVA